MLGLEQSKNYWHHERIIMHYYQHSIGDYRRDTMHLSLLEHGVYRQLLDLYYLNECELNANAMRLVCARNAEEMQAVETVLNEFFIKTETGYSHKRCDAEIERFHEKSLKAKASADARWKPTNANAMRTHSEGNANHKPITNNHSKGSRLSKDFVLPQEWIDEALKIHTHLPSKEIKDIFDTFKDYWIGKAGKDGVKSDWLATWRNWIRRQELKPNSKPRGLVL
jgi:uncharacterized protein YdaU (DUF1376 family)